ncbi:AraC family transcriptional regulator [Dietzia psychralcaliphila]|uniref:AraC family transcriptional regulator n=1 Tax=Dietzia psychralcaliphila TaxID=139021 RepID=UPI001C1E3901|nr:AraC family transcriptional regulator [Dietzia psychralcaliphila]
MTIRPGARGPGSSVHATTVHTAADATTADSVSRLTSELRSRGIFHCDTRMAAGVTLLLPPMPETVMFHAAIGGRCSVTVDGTTTRLEPGEVALLPHGAGHAISTGPGETVLLESAPRRSLGGIVERLELGSGPLGVHAICGALTVEHPAAPPLPATIDPLVVVPSRSAVDRQRVALLADLILEEADAAAPGWTDVTSHLVDALALRAFRHVVLDAPPGHGWWSALREPRVAAAIAAIHDRPEVHWDVAALARVAGMSRSAFAVLFGEVTGDTPIRWATNYRMRLARAQLAAGATTSSVARRSGYDSEVAFRRAFRRTTGVTPGSVRRSGAPPG